MFKRTVASQNFKNRTNNITLKWPPITIFITRRVPVEGEIINVEIIL